MKPSGKDYLGHRARIKEKYLKSGLEGWLDHEILEFLLFFPLHRKDTKPAAKRLLEKFRTVGGVLNADVRELSEVSGAGPHTAVFLKLLKDVAILYQQERMEGKDLVNSPGLVYDYLKASLKGAPDEEFRVLYLNTRNKLITVEKLHEGTVNRSAVYPRKVAERALYHHCTSVIISHNHPAGSLSPSPDDMEATKSISRALSAVEVDLLDHVIIGGGGYFSFAENGLGL